MYRPMQIKRKPTAIGLAVAYLLWEALVQPIWNLNLERVAEQNKIDGTLAGFAPVTWLREIGAYLPSSFAAGFVVGALIFAYWDNIVAKFRRYILRKPDGETEDEEEEDQRLWIGNVEAYAPNIYGDGRFLIFVTLLNIGPRVVRLKRVQGAAIARFKNREGVIKPMRLQPLVIGDPQSHTEGIEPGYSFTFMLHQYVTRDTAEQIISNASKSRGFALDLREIRLVLELEGSSEDHELPIWEGICIRAGEIGSTRTSFL